MEILFKASQAYKLLTEPRKKSNDLSETTKTYLLELWLELNYGYREVVMTPEILKGLECEEEALTLVQNVKGGELRLKNNKKYSNEYIVGTPDVVLSDCVEEYKISSTLKTFMSAELTQQYYVQCQCYMALTGLKKARLYYCLIPAPQKFVNKEIQRYYYMFEQNSENEQYKNIENQLLHNNNIILQIPENKRVKEFEIDYDPQIIENLYEKIVKCREFLNNLTL